MSAAQISSLITKAALVARQIRNHLILLVLGSAVGFVHAAAVLEPSVVRPCKNNLDVRNIAQLRSKRRFADLVRREAWSRVPTARHEDNVYQSSSLPELVLRKGSALAAARLQIAASQILARDSVLAPLVRIMPLVEIGRDFVTTKKMPAVIATQDLNSKNPDRAKAFQAIARVRSRIREVGDTAQLAAKQILQANLADSAKIVYWDPARAQLVLPYLELAGTFNDVNTAVIQTIGEGRLLIGHRPRFDDFRKLAESGVDVVVTVLGQGEDAAQIGALVKEAGMGWEWLDLGSANIATAAQESERIQRFVNDTLRPLFANEDGYINTVYLHCSAGIHRTGMIAYGLLRAMGLTPAAAHEKLRDLRPISAQGVGAQRLRFMDSLF